MEMMERGHAGSERMYLLHALDWCVWECVRVCVLQMKVKLYIRKICTE